MVSSNAIENNTLITTCSACGGNTTATTGDALGYGSDADFCAGCGRSFTPADKRITFIDGVWHPTVQGDDGGLKIHADAPKTKTIVKTITARSAQKLDEAIEGFLSDERLTLVDIKPSLTMVVESGMIDTTLMVVLVCTTEVPA